MPLTISQIKQLIAGGALSEAVIATGDLCKPLTFQMRNQAHALIGEYSEIQNYLLNVPSDPLARKVTFRLKLIEFLSQLELDPVANNQLEVIEIGCLFRENRLPFLDRKEFRKLLSKLTKSPSAEVLFVSGAEKSGMTYLENYLAHLTKFHNNIDLIRINAATEFDTPNGLQGLKLTQYLSVKLKLNLIHDGVNDDQLKFEIFVTRLKEKLETSKQIHIVFIHDFHKLEVVTEDLRKFIYKLLDNFKQEYPRLIFILAGFEYSELTNWSTDLQMLCHLYHMESLQDQHIVDCLDEIYDQFGEQLKQSTGADFDKENYKQQMLPIIVGNHVPIDIEYSGLKLIEHLTYLNNL